MKRASRLSFCYRLKALFCITLVMNLHLWLGGCGVAPESLLPQDQSIRIDIASSNPLAEALHGTVFAGPVAFEINPGARSFRIIFKDETLKLQGRYAPAHGSYAIADLTFGRFGRSMEMALDSSKRVMSVVGDDGVGWYRPAKSSKVSAASAATGSTGAQAYIDANQDLLDFAREVDRLGGDAVFGSSPTGGSPDPGVGPGSPAIAAEKLDIALIGGRPLALFVMGSFWVPFLAIAGVLLKIFLVLAVLQILIAMLEPPVLEPIPPIDGGPGAPSPLFDCNANGTEDEMDLLEGSSRDCNGNGVPDECDIANRSAADCNGNRMPDTCEDDTDSDGIIDDCDNCPDVGNPAQTDSDGNGVGDACATILIVAAEPNSPWIYETLRIAETDVTLCEVDFSAVVGTDPLGNTSYTYNWMIAAPADRSGAQFIEVSGGNSALESFKAPPRPSFSPSGEMYVVTVEVTGDQFGNMGTAMFMIEVRLLGDVNDDGSACPDDQAIIRAVENGNETDPTIVTASDVNCDGFVDALDRQIIESFPTNCR